MSNSVQTQEHLATVERFGGPLAYWTSLCYRCFRLGMNSPELAAYYGIPPITIRQQLYRLSLVARAVFPDPDEHLPRYKLVGPLKGFKTLRRAAQ